VKLDVGDRKFLVLALEVYPRRAVADWAAGVLDANPDREAIVLTHAYLSSYGLLAPPNEYMGSLHFWLNTPEQGMCGEQLWDYQSAPGGGEGWVGLVEFKGGTGKATFSAYRTWARSGLGYDVKRPASIGPIEVDWAH
jgi:hypothetical protein